MSHTSISALLVTLFVLILFSAFFSASETGMMALNRYRLKHLTKTSRAAKRVQKLLDRPDRLLGVILLGNNFVNIMASAITSIIALRLFGDMGVIIGSIFLTFILLIFGEVSPKTLAALYPERIAFFSSRILQIFLWLLYPLVWLINIFSNSLLRLLGINVKRQKGISISREELRTVVHEAAGRIPSKHQSMLLGILDLEQVTVEDIMIPRNEILAIDLSHSWEAIKAQLSSTQHTLLPVYQNDLNDLIGILHVKHALHVITQADFSKETLKNILMETYFVPEGTTLATQLINFQKNKKRLGLVVDEYGELLGLITLEDIFEEIVGEFTTDMASETQEVIHPQPDGSVLVDGSTTLRDLNRLLDLKLPVTETKTLSGLIIEYLQMIPESGTCCLIKEIPIEVIQVQDNRIKTVKIMPKWERSLDKDLTS